MIRPLPVERRFVYLTIDDSESRHDLVPSPRTGVGDLNSEAAWSETASTSPRSGADNSGWNG
jgi:hypothetical protein